MIASLTAHRAELIQQAHQWAQVTVDKVVPVGQAPARRAELAERSFTAEVACALRIPERTAQSLIAESDRLVAGLPASFAALAEGRIGYAHARVLVDETSGLAPEDRREVESAVIDAASRLTASRLRPKTRRARERLHPETIGARVKAAVADRSVTTEYVADGMGWLSVYAQAPLIAGIDDRITQAAKRMRDAGDPRTMAQLRADIAAMLLLGDGSGAGMRTNAHTSTRPSADADASTDVSASTVASTSADTPTSTEGAVGEPRGGEAGGGEPGAGEPGRRHVPRSAMEPLAALLAQVRPELDVMVPALTQLGVSEMPATLNGVVPIDPDTARRLAVAAPSFTRILTHPETGVVLSVGRERYRPPPDLARYIRLRDGTCRFPGCNRKAKHTEIDHTVQRQAGGLTQYDNLACLCEKHHHLKDETVWKVVQRPGGVLEWTSPAGRVYTTDPELELPAPDLMPVAEDAQQRAADAAETSDAANDAASDDAANDPNDTANAANDDADRAPF